MKKSLVLVLITLFTLNGFAQKKPIDHVNFYKVGDLEVDAVFKDKRYKKYYNKRYETKVFMDNYFYPWSLDKVKFPQKFRQTKEFYVFFSTTPVLKGKCIKGNYDTFSKNEIARLSENLDYNTFPNQIGEYGIVLKNTDVRELPTDEYCFKRVRSAGEGYPFDYFQYTTLWMSTPVLIIHLSRDGQWCFVASPYSKGWVRWADVGLLKDEQVKDIQSRKMAVITTERTSIRTSYQYRLANIGTVLPLEDKNTVLVPRKINHTTTTFEEVKLKTSEMAEMPLEFNASNVSEIMAKLLDNKYSWGGLGGGRDCSATLKDFMTPFGIWLPRNSSQQYKVGKRADVKGNRKQKIQTISAEGIPFLSVIYKRGHSMLYAGNNKKGVPLIFHNPWGLKVKIKDDNLGAVADYREEFGVFGVSGRDFYTNVVKSRYIIGKSVITTIEPESTFPKSDKVSFDYFLDNIISINRIVK